MFNTPLGKKLFENTMSLSYNIMTAKAKLYTNHYNMIEDFIKRNKSNIYFKKAISSADIIPIIQYVNDCTNYRIDIKSGNEVLIQNIKNQLDAGCIKHSDFNTYDKPKNNIDLLNAVNDQVGFWFDKHHNKLTFVINTGMPDSAVLNIDIELVG